MSKVTLADLVASARADDPSTQQLAGLEKKLAHLFVPPGGGGGTGGGGGHGTPHGGGAGATKGAAGVAVKKGAAAKWLAAALGAAGAGAVIHHVVTSDDAPAVVAKAPAIAPAPTPAPVAPPDAAVETPSVETPPPPDVDDARDPSKPTAAKPAHRGSAEPENTLAAESKLLEQARTALASKQAQSALQICERHAHRYPHGQLGEERERIAIEALVALDRRDAARERAKRFDAAFPNSVQSGRIHALVDGR